MAQSGGPAEHWSWRGKPGRVSSAVRVSTAISGRVGLEHETDAKDLREQEGGGQAVGNGGNDDDGVGGLCGTGRGAGPGGDWRAQEERMSASQGWGVAAWRDVGSVARPRMRPVAASDADRPSSLWAGKTGGWPSNERMQRRLAGQNAHWSCTGGRAVAVEGGPSPKFRRGTIGPADDLRVGCYFVVSRPIRPALGDQDGFGGARPCRVMPGNPHGPWPNQAIEVGPIRRNRSE